MIYVFFKPRDNDNLFVMSNTNKASENGRASQFRNVMVVNLSDNKCNR